jgi:hypothetical protein
MQRINAFNQGFDANARPRPLTRQMPTAITERVKVTIVERATVGFFMVASPEKSARWVKCARHITYDAEGIGRRSEKIWSTGGNVAYLMLFGA